MSSSDPNMQNIPSHITDIRKMFIASAGENYVEASNNCFIIDRFCEVNTSAGWKFADKVVIGDKLLVEEDGVQVEIFVTKIDNLVDKNQIVYYYE